jgi:hypothetical protein
MELYLANRKEWQTASEITMAVTTEVENRRAVDSDTPMVGPMGRWRADWTELERLKVYKMVDPKETGSLTGYYWASN